MATYTNVNDAMGRYGMVTNTVTAFDDLPDFSSDGYMQNKTSRFYKIGDNVGTFQGIENGVDSNGVDLPCAFFYDYDNSLNNHIVWGEQLFYLQDGSFLSMTQPTTPGLSSGGGGGGNANSGNGGGGNTNGGGTTGSGSGGSGSGSGDAGSGSGSGSGSGGNTGGSGGTGNSGQPTTGSGSGSGIGPGVGGGIPAISNLLSGVGGWLILGLIVYFVANRKK
jgi:hypothetical protein